MLIRATLIAMLSWLVLAIAYGATQSSTQDQFASTSREALTALMDCRRAMANASGAPWAIEEQARVCDEKFASNAPPAGSQPLTCWNALEVAEQELRTAADLYAKGRRAVSPEQGQLVREAQRHHRLANDAIKRADQCIQITWDTFNSNGGGRRPRDEDDARRRDQSGRLNGPIRARIGQLLADIVSCWKAAMPTFREPTLVPTSDPAVLAQYDPASGKLTYNTEKLQYECTTRAETHLEPNTINARNGALTEGQTSACLALYLAHEMGHRVQSLRGNATKGKDAELEADRLAGQVLRCLVGNGLFTSADVARATEVFAVFGEDDAFSKSDPHGTAKERQESVEGGFSASLLTPRRP